MSKTIMLLARDEEHLSKEERRNVEERYGKNVQYVRCDPSTPEEHLANCERLKPVTVLLVPDEPVYGKAVRKGVEHAVFAPARKITGRTLLRVVGPVAYSNLQFFMRYFPVELAYFNHKN